MAKRQIPVVIIGGYLGAGKTTFINQILKENLGKRTTVLVNDFGAINIDSDLIENQNGETFSLTNGCACCTIGNSLLETALLVTSTSPSIDLLIVEASGVAEPQRVASILAGVASLYQASVLVNVDCSTIQKRSEDKFVGKLVLSQISSARTIVLNRFDKLDKVRRDQKQWISNLAPNAMIWNTPFSGRGFMNILEYTLAQSNQSSLICDQLPIENGMKNLTLDCSKPLNREKLLAFFNRLPVSVHRAKGFCLLQSAWTKMATSYKIQYTGTTCKIEILDKLQQKNRLGLVFIGPIGDEEVSQIRNSFADCFIKSPGGSNPAAPK